VCDEASLDLALQAAKQKARCDFAQFLAAGQANSQQVAKLVDRCVGMKMYLDQTYGPLRLNDPAIVEDHFKSFPKHSVIAVHAEGSSLELALRMAEVHRKRLHCCHISRKEEILMLRAAKERGVQVTCEVTPHHLFLSEEDIPHIGERKAEVRPRLGRSSDRQALWDNLDVIDCIASDHAPHLLTEKEGSQPVPGFPGLETSLPLLFNAVNENRLTIGQVIEKCYTNPRRIYHLPEQAETFVEVDEDASWTITGQELFTRCAWSPFEGYTVRGRIRRVTLRGELIFCDHQILARPGSGHNVRETPSHFQE
jgi:carbamoyl-phosphate synthase/aspartate carbamoyltransferase/dihydroorotase